MSLRGLAMLVALVLFAGAADAANGRRARGFWYTRASARTVVGVMGFSEDGTRALLQEKSSVRGGGASVLTRYVVVDSGGTLFETAVSDVVFLQGRAPIEHIDNATCRDRIAALEGALAGFRAVKARPRGCAQPTRGDDVIEIEKSTPTPMLLSAEMQTLQEELGIGPGLIFVNERGPLVVVLRASFEDPFGKSNEALTFLRSDPRINDRWPAP